MLSTTVSFVPLLSKGAMQATRYPVSSSSTPPPAEASTQRASCSSSPGGVDTFATRPRETTREMGAPGPKGDASARTPVPTHGSSGTACQAAGRGGSSLASSTAGMSSTRRRRSLKLPPYLDPVLRGEPHLQPRRAKFEKASSAALMGTTAASCAERASVAPSDNLNTTVSPVEPSKSAVVSTNGGPPGAHKARPDASTR
mmetsp:Transcript_60903/g.178029  ORF Transcript_60903/g.178029 Transcript_60903/m.178029 type:complete len:200 (-) Transcript_60903:164-763(-)